MTDSSTAQKFPRSPWGGFCSLLLFLHLFCLAMMLSSNYSPSPLQNQLRYVFTPYTRTLNFDPDLTPYHLTHDMLDDTDHRLEYLPENADPEDQTAWVSLSDRGWSGFSPRRQRYQRLAATLARYAEADDSDQVVVILRAVASHLLKHDGLKIRQIRCLRYIPPTNFDYLEERSAGRRAEGAMQEVHRASVIISGDLQVDIVKIEAAGRSAAPSSQ